MINELELRRLYLVEHLTMQQIGERLECSRQNVHYLLRKYRVDVSTAERFTVACDWCGSEFSITRKRFISRKKHFCGKTCYTGYMHNPEYKQWRTGQRIGRIVMEEKLGRGLRPGETMHHEDGDDGNNESENLRLFGSHSEHMAYHHRVRQERDFRSSQTVA